MTHAFGGTTAGLRAAGDKLGSGTGLCGRMVSMVSVGAVGSIGSIGSVRPFLALSVAVVAWSSCAKTSSQSGTSGQTARHSGSGWVKVGAFEVKPPDDKGDYEFKGKFPRRYPCQKDGDCALTYLRAGHCCPDQCEAQAANKEWMATLRQLHYPTCRQWRKTHGFKACGKVKCPVPKGVPRARCIEHRCRVAYRPVVGRVKYRTVSPPRLTSPPEKPGRSGTQSRTARKNRVQ